MSEWYLNGLGFSCTQCGNCCTGPTGAVWFTPDEGKAMAIKLGVTESDFYFKFARKIGLRWSLKENVINGQFDCIFLQRNDSTATCSLYETRPSQCRTWPFWPEVLKSKSVWEKTKRETPCPGMDSGKIVPIESIRIQRDS